MKLRFLSLTLMSALSVIYPNLGQTHPNLAYAETFQEALIASYNHPRLQAERTRLREIDETYVQAQSGGRLTGALNLSTGIVGTDSKSLNFATGTEISLKDTSYPRNLSLEFIQPLYQGGRIKALKSQAKASILAARESLRQSEQNIFQSAAIAYVDVLRDEEQARIRRKNISVLSQQEEAAKLRFDVGVGTRTDIAQTQSRLASAEIGLAQAEAQLASSRATYTQIIGHSPVGLVPVPAIGTPKSLEAAQDIALENNPALLANLLNQDAAKAALNVAKAASRPTIGLVGTAQGAKDPTFGVNRSNSASIVAQISIPIFSGGLNRSNKRVASEAKSRAVYETRDTKRLIRQNVAQIWAQLNAANRVRRASQTQVESAKIAFEGVVLEQEVGTRTTLDVLDAEQELLTAKLAVIQARRDAHVATYQLLNIMGVFDAQALQLPLERYDPNQNFDKVRLNNTLLERSVSIVTKGASENR